MGKLFTDEQVAQANSINILDYARQAGYPIEQITPKEYKIPGYGGMRIDGNGRKWNCFSAQTGGGPIQFVMYMESIPWREAVQKLLGFAPGLYIAEGALEYHRPMEKDIEKEKKEFALPEKNNTYKHIFAYLTQSRKIDKEFVQAMVDRKMLYENTYRSCVFVGYDNSGTPAYASVRSSNTEGTIFRGDVEGSDKRWAFRVEGKTDTVRVFEAPIDLMSYQTFLKICKQPGLDDHYLALGCLGDVALKQYLQNHPEVDHIMFCLDNDQRGREALERFKEEYKNDYSLSQHLPKLKDWNETLIGYFQEVEKEADLSAEEYEYEP